MNSLTITSLIIMALLTTSCTTTTQRVISDESVKSCPTPNVGHDSDFIMDSILNNNDKEFIYPQHNK